jgi:hypothetical protein
LVIRSGTLEGVTFSSMMKDGRRRTAVFPVSCSGRGIFEAESMRRLGRSVSNSESGFSCHASSSCDGVVQSGTHRGEYLHHW